MQFEDQYFMDPCKQVSNYVDYRKRKYAEVCDELIRFCGMVKEDRIVDFGCATGSLLFEFKKRGFRNIKGTDVSYWAIEWGLENLGLEGVLDHYNRNLLVEPKDHCVMLDVLEHIPSVREIMLVLELARRGLKKCLVVRVPVSAREGEDYYLIVSRSDKTHVQCHARKWWLKLLSECGYKFGGSLQRKGVIWSSKGVFAGVFKPE